VEEVGRILLSVVNRYTHDSDPRLVQVLSALWPRAVGRGIAEHSRPVSLASGTLTLVTACPAWTVQLGQMREDVRAAINGFLGKPLVRKVRVRHMPSLALQGEKPSYGSD
jgi:predicted nucleic acid-binding Zn ribbon protein